MYAAHFQNNQPGHNKWYYLAVIPSDVPGCWVVRSGWGRIGYNISTSNERVQSVDEGGDPYRSDLEALDLMVAVAQRRLTVNYRMVFATPRFLGKMMSLLPGLDNPHSGTVHSWMSMNKLGHMAVVDMAPLWFKDIFAARSKEVESVERKLNNAAGAVVPAPESKAESPSKRKNSKENMRRLMAKAEAKVDSTQESLDDVPNEPPPAAEEPVTKTKPVKSLRKLFDVKY